MYAYPTPIKNLIKHLSSLPGIGPKQAERMVFYLLKSDVGKFESLAKELSEIKNKIKKCAGCGNFVEEKCEICNSQKRDKNKICVVAEPQDILALEKTSEFDGVYHLLGGLIIPTAGLTPSKLKIQELEDKIKNTKNNLEIIIALDPNVEGESTSMYLVNLLKKYPHIKISKLARGLPMGGDLEYADEVTLGSAIRGRVEL
jgi:recombination protein RecR